MSHQHETIAILDKAASILEKLAPEITYEEDARHASAKLFLAADALRVEPLRSEDIGKAVSAHHGARASLVSLYDHRGKLPEPLQAWLLVSVDGWEATSDLLDALSTLHSEIRLEPKAARMGQGLRRLLPASWWGGR